MSQAISGSKTPYECKSSTDTALEIPLQEITVCKRYLKKKYFKTLTSVLKLGYCTSLDLSSSERLTDDKCSAIFKALGEGKGAKLRKLDLSNNKDLTSETVCSYNSLSAAGQLSNLETLNISNLSLAFCMGVVNDLWHNRSPNLTSLSMKGCGLNDPQFIYLLGDIAYGCSHLQFLDARGNSLTDASKKAVKEQVDTGLLTELKTFILAKKYTIRPRTKTPSS